MDHAGDINRAVIHSHGTTNGVVGNGMDIGLYVNYPGAKGSATSKELADAILSGRIDVDKGGKIVFFACNSDALAASSERRSSRLGGRYRTIEDL